MNHMDFDNEYTVTIGEREPTETVDFGNGGAELEVAVYSVSDWTSLAFVLVRDDEGPFFRVIRSLAGQVLVEALKSPQPVRRGGKRPVWTDVGDLDLDPQTGALRAHVAAMPVPDFVAKLLNANESALEEEQRTLDHDHERMNAQAELVAMVERRCAALGIADPVSRDVAVRMADTWAGSADQLTQVAAEIADPLVLETDATPPAL